MGVKVYKAKVKKEWNGKNLWVDVGYTVFLKDDGKMNLLDERTGTSYYLFNAGDRKKKDEPEAHVATPADPLDQDIPF
mgnify:CR=1 FL=1